MSKLSIRAGLLATVGFTVFLSGAAAAKPVEYVKVCSLYGAGFYYIPGTDQCIKIGGWARPEEVGTGVVCNGQTFNPGSTCIRSGPNVVNVKPCTTEGTVRGYVATGTACPEGLNRAFVEWAGITGGLSESFYDFYSPTLFLGGSFMSDQGKTQEVNGAGVQTNLFSPSGTGTFLEAQASWLFYVRDVPIPQIGGNDNIPILAGPVFQANIGGQIPAVTTFGSPALGTLTKTNFVVGGEVDAVVMPNMAVGGFVGWLDGRQTNFINFAPGDMVQTHWVQGVAFGGIVKVADQNVPGLLVFGQIEGQDYNQTTTPGGTASPGFTYHMQQTAVVVTGGVAFTSDFWAQGINFGSKFRH